MKRIIGVMGNISAGKTTLCKLIGDGSVRYASEDADALLDVIEQALERDRPQQEFVPH